MASFTAGNRASVTLVPSLDGFQRRAAAGIKSTKVPDVKVRMDLDRDSVRKAEAEVTAAAKKIEAARETEIKSSEKVRLAETKLAEARSKFAADSSRVVAAENQLNAARREHVRTQSAVSKATVDHESATTRAAAATERFANSQRRSSSALHNIGAAFRSIDSRNLDRGLSNINGKLRTTALVSAAASSALVGIGGATGPTLAVGAALVTATGAAWLLPGALMAAGAGFAALKIGMSGVGDALKGDAEALAALAPSARAAVNELTGLKGTWDGVKNSVQGELFDGLADRIKQVAAVQLPVLKTGLTDIAGGFNTGAHSIAAFLASGRGVGNVTTILKGTAGAADEVGLAAGPLAGILTGVGAIGASWLPRLTAGFGDAAQRMSDWVNSAAGIETINGWISRGLDAIGHLARLVGGLGSILGSVFGAMNAAGASTIETIADLTQQFAGWLRTTEGAQTLSTVFGTIRQVIENLRPGVAAVGQVLLDLINSVAPHLPTLASGFSQLAITIYPLASFLASLAGYVVQGLGWLLNTAPGLVWGLAGAFGALSLAVKAYGIWQSLATTRLILYNVWVGITQAATKIWAGMQWLLNAALSANPIGLIVLAIVGLVAGIIWAYNNVGWFRDAVNWCWEKMKAFGAWIASAFTATLNFLGGVFSSVWNWIKTTAVNVWNGIASFFATAWAGFTGFFQSIWNGISSFFSWVWNSMKLSATIAWLYVQSWFYGALASFTSWWSGVWNGISSFFSWIWEGVKSVASGAWDWIVRKLTDGVNGFARFFSDAWTGIKDGFGRIWAGIQDLAKAPVRFVVDTVLNKGIGGLWNAAAGLFGLGKWNDFILPPGFATGGAVRGPGTATSDSIPARLSDGEFVLNAQDVRNLGGFDGVEKMRRNARVGLPAYASGGPVSWQELQRVILGQFPRARITDTTRPGARDQHGQGRAIDIAGPRSMDMPFMLNVNRWIAGNYGNSHELIHTQPGAVNLKRGRPHNYSGSVQAGHRNHIHWSNNGGGAGDALGRFFGGVGDWVVSMVQQLTDAIAGPESWLRGAMSGWVDNGSTISELPGAAMNKLLTVAKDWLFGKAEEADAAGGGGGLAGPGSGPVVDQVRAVANRFGWGDGAQWDALSRLIQKESSWNPTISNPRSTAYGLFQFLNGTWGTVGGRKTSNPGEQAEYGLRYIKQRYQTPVGALGFHLKNNWYDNGGYLKPGASRVMNGTGKPEAVLTDGQWAVAHAAVAHVSRAVSDTRSGRGLDLVTGSRRGEKSIVVNNDNKFVETIDIDSVSFLAGNL